MIDYKQKRFEAIAASIADGLRHGIDYQPGDEVGYEVRYGDEGPDSWTRGEAEITAGHIARAKEILA